MKTKTLAMSVCMLWTIVSAVTVPVQAQDNSQVENTKHNLTASGPGTVKVGRGTEACMFCHTPHASNPIAPLWNRNDPGNYYDTYESTTMVATVDQPTGTSRLCLSCHDGTIALTQTYNPNNNTGGTIYITPADRGYIGTDLSDDHPISFTYDDSVASEKGELRNPGNLPPELPLDHNKQLQCTTCHDAHNNTHGQFLRMDNTGSQMCLSCHDIFNWSSSIHATANAPLASATRDDWDNLSAVTVADAACGSCHRTHSAGGRQRLLRFGAEEDNCLNCHDGSVATKNIAGMLNDFSIHDVRATTGVHDPTEHPIDMDVHVECVDCHGPHRVTRGSAIAPVIKPSMTGATGVTESGQIVDPANYEYQVCYKCHSKRNFAIPVVDRVEGTNDISKEFSATSESYHPVVTTGKNPQVPSLFQNLNTASVIYCTDCHGSSDSNVKGPHGSTYQPLLQLNYNTLDNTAESPEAYALCYRCHNRQSIIGDESFSQHNRHIIDANTPCSVCHDPHGVEHSSHLINFDADIVLPADGGDGPSYQSTGVYSGTCTLKCHNRNHQDKVYTP